MKIRSVRAVTADVPLPRPITMGEVCYGSREYVLVEVRTDEGLSGIGFGMSRDAPVASMVTRNIAPLLVGEDPRDTERLWRRLYQANLIISQCGVFMRALSAIDIALWDLKARALGTPLWRLLGGYRSRVPVQVAGAYPRSDQAIPDLEDEIADYAERGFQFIKIAAGPLADDAIRIEAARRTAVGRHLTYDVHWAWKDALDVLPIVRTWREIGLDMIEDPFPSHLAAHATRLREATGIPLALGEDHVGRWAFRDLLHSGLADLVRLDATTVGGISEAVKIIAMASAYGLAVSPHVFPEIHVHLGAAFENVRTVEITDPTRGYETLHRLFSRWIEIDRGQLIVPDAPGLGVEVDWAAVEAYRRS